MKLTYHPGAKVDIAEAVAHYRDIRSELADRFIQELDRGFDRIENAPDRWSIWKFGLRAFVLTGFPYTIGYRRLSNSVRILTVKHHSRGTAYLRKRLKD